MLYFICTPECDVILLPFEISREVVVLSNVWDATSGLLHQLHSVVIKGPCDLSGKKI